MKSYAVITVWIMGLFFLVSCSIVDENVSEVQSTTRQAVSSQILPTQEMPTVPPTEQSVEIVTRSISMPTPTRQIIPSPYPTKTAPSPTPFPTFDVASSTLSEEAATQNLVELLETNRGCELPCWWGIMPGETGVASIESTFVPLGFDWYRDYEELEDRTPYLALIYFTTFEDGVVKSIEVRGGAEEETYDRNAAWRPYAIPYILERLGMPDDIYVFYPFRFDRYSSEAYRLFFYYHDLGVEIDYMDEASLIEERPGWARACPNILETDVINLFLFQPGTVPNYLRHTLPSSTLPLPALPEGTNPFDLVSWEQATDSSLDEFWHLFTESEEGSVCFDFKTYWTGN